MKEGKGVLVNFKQFEHEKVALGDGRIVEAVGCGNVYMNKCLGESKLTGAILYNVLYVPKLACNLFSVRAAVLEGNTVEFGHSKCWIRDAGGKLRGMGSLNGQTVSIKLLSRTLVHTL